MIWLGFLLRVIVAFVNAYYGPTPGAGLDAADFHAVAVDFSRTLRPNANFYLGLLYSIELGVLYRLTYPSLFLGGVYSALAWLASAYVLLQIMRLLDIRGTQRALAMCVYALFPSSILFTGVTLRESYQLLSVNLAVYASLMIYLYERMRHWFLLVAAVVFGGVLHAGILAFGVFIAAVTPAWLLLKKRSRIGRRRVMLAITLAALMIGIAVPLFWRLYDYQLGEGLAAAIESYQRGGLSIAARTHYKTDVSITGTGDLIVFVLAGLFKYLFEPMPWRPLLLIDVPTVLENLVRAMLIASAVVTLTVMRSRRRAPVALVFVFYLAFELMFSFGTVNWGTAVRHHVPSIGLLVVCGFARGPRRLGERANEGDVGVPAERLTRAEVSA